MSGDCCPTCKRPLAETRYCVACSEPFVLDENTQNWFRRKGLSLPRRCQGCREARRGEKAGAEPVVNGRKADGRHAA